MERDPDTGKDVDFENVIMGASIPTNFIPAVEKVCLNVVLYALLTLTSMVGVL
jgi:elongation factor G